MKISSCSAEQHPPSFSHEHLRSPNGRATSMKLRLIEKRREAADATTSFIFYPDHPLKWQAGQFLHYVLPHDNADDRQDDRYFTIASAPQETNVRLTARFS